MKFPIMEHFYTVQGEGAYSGFAAYFIRLAGCDVGCVWCDVKESWHTDGYPQHTAAEMLAWVQNSGADRVVITGGEPAMYDLNSICELFNNEGIFVHIETSAAHPIRGKFHWITISPKKFKAPLKSEMPKANELKIIIFNKSDFEWAEKWAELCDANCRKYLQPEWDKREEMTPLIVEYVKKNPHWHVSLQTHKYMGIP